MDSCILPLAPFGNFIDELLQRPIHPAGQIIELYELDGVFDSSLGFRIRFSTHIEIKILLLEKVSEDSCGYNLSIVFFIDQTGVLINYQLLDTTA